jgi:hypothetical protein
VHEEQRIAGQQMVSNLQGVAVHANKARGCMIGSNRNRL